MVLLRTSVALCLALQGSSRRIMKADATLDTDANATVQEKDRVALCKKTYAERYDFAAVDSIGATPEENSIRGLAAVKLDVSMHTGQALLHASPHQHWRAELEKPMEKRGSWLQWYPMPDRQGGARPPAQVIDLRGELTKIVRKKGESGTTRGGETVEMPAILEFHYNNGQVDSLQGGVHASPKQIRKAVLRNSYTRHETGASFDASKEIAYKAKGNDFVKIEQDALKRCIGWNWCMGFQYNPNQQVCEGKCKGESCKWNCAATLIHYLGTPSKPVDATDVAMGGPVECPSKKLSCKGYEPTPLTQWKSVMYTPKNAEGMEIFPKSHFMTKENIYDSITGDGKFGTAVGKSGSETVDFERVLSYRKANRIGTERMWADLRCVAGLKNCGDGLLVVEPEVCPGKK